MPLLRLIFCCISTTLWKGKSTYFLSQQDVPRSCSKFKPDATYCRSGWPELLKYLAEYFKTAKKIAFAINRSPCSALSFTLLNYLFTNGSLFSYHNQAYFSRLIGSLFTFSFIFSFCLIFHPILCVSFIIGPHLSCFVRGAVLIEIEHPWLACWFENESFTTSLGLWNRKKALTGYLLPTLF